MNHVVNRASIPAIRSVAWTPALPARHARRLPVGDVRAGFAVPDGRPGVFPRPSGELAPPATRFADLLGERDVVLGLPAKGKRSALARLAAALGERVGLPPDSVLAAMLRRERLGSTAIGHGVAVPHARLDGIPTPKAMIATLQRPVWFGAPDNEPVDLLLAVLWPKSDNAGFLPALARFCRLLRHADLRNHIRASETPAEALAWMEFFEEREAIARC